MSTNDLWLFVVFNQGKTWIRAAVPMGIDSVNAMVSYLKRGGWVEPISDTCSAIPTGKFMPKVIGMTVLAKLVE